jgi:hypothetical protein
MFYNILQISEKGLVRFATALRNFGARINFPYYRTETLKSAPKHVPTINTNFDATNLRIQPSIKKD